VTDANLLLGRLNPAYFADGELQLDVASATSAISDNVAAHYAMTPEEAALGMITVINSTMARLLWEVMIGRGYDPRDFSLLAFGGAGPLHACALAQALAIREVIVPVMPGTFSALGMISADIRRDLERMIIGAEHVSDEELTAAYRELEDAALTEVESEHAGYERVDFYRFAELRYAGQHHPLSVEIPNDRNRSPGIRARAHTAFQEQHLRLYGFSRDATPVELMRIQVSAIGRVRRVARAPAEAPRQTAAVPRELRRRLYLEDGHREAPVFRRGDLDVGFAVIGPCVVEEATSTTYVPPDCKLEVDGSGNLRVAVSAVEGVGE
jgi:N-methylhydantoinase A